MTFSNMVPRSAWLRGLAIILGAAGAVLATAETNRFGFTGPEIFPIDNGIAHLKSADIDGDGRLDLIVVNNARSKINILYNQTGSPKAASTNDAPDRRDINELPPDARFRIDSIASEKRISSIVVADLNSDGRPDIAYFGEPKELIVQYNLGTNGWAAAKRFPLDDGVLDAYAMATGDLNGDGLPDLLLLAEKHIHFLAQNKNGAFDEPKRIPYSGSVKSLQVLDIQGDGKDDLLLVNWDHPVPFRFRLQGEGGQLGPECMLSSPPIRSFWADDLDGDRRTEIVTIAQKSGRAQLHLITRKEGEPLAGTWKAGQFSVLPLPRSDKARRGSVWADINGDGMADLVTADPEGGQILVALQQADGSMSGLKAFPSLTGVGDIAAADWKGDGRTQLFLLSSDEKQIGVTALDANGRLPFPTLLPLGGKPLAMAVGVVTPGRPPELATIVEVGARRELVIRDAQGKTRRQRLAESFKANPSSLAIVDANQDGLPDLLLLIPYEKVKALIQLKGGGFEETDVNAPGGAVEQPWLATADVDTDGKAEILLPQRGLLRAVVLQPEDKPAKGTNKTAWSFIVREQINAASANSRIVAASAIPAPGSKSPGLFMLDAERKALTLCLRDENGVWQARKSVPIPFTDFQEIRPLAMGAAVPNAVALAGPNAAGWLRLDGPRWELEEKDGYETRVKDGLLRDLVSGDLNQDGVKDLVFLETGRGYVDLVTFEKPHQLRPSNRWQVFEERTFRSRRNDLSEPREALVADVTGDKKNDLILLVHDRILVYPQE